MTRVAGAGALALAAVLLLTAGGVPAAAVACIAAAVLSFALWRTLAGVTAGCALMLAAALAQGLAQRRVPDVALPLTLLAALSLGSVAYTAALATRGWPSRRFTGAVLAATGIAANGVAMLGAPRTAVLGSAAVAGALCYWLGAVPAYAWAPLLFRHERRPVEAAGVVALLAAAASLWWVVPRLPAPGAARITLAVLGAAALPFGLWHAWRQRRRDPRCARSYAAVVLGATLCLVRACA